MAEDRHITKRSISSKSFLLAWPVLTAGTGLVSWLIIAIAGVFTWGGALLCAGTLTGLCTGLVQAQLLKRYFPQLGVLQWAKSSTVGATLGWLTAGLVFLLVQIVDIKLLNGLIRNSNTVLLPGVIIVGTIFGWIQGWMQWRYVQRDNRLLWATASAIGWASGFFLGLCFALIFIPYRDYSIFSYVDAQYTLVIGTVGTSVSGIITGITFNKVVQRDIPTIATRRWTSL